MRTSSAGTINRQEAGVTLVEMLIVVALIGLLSAITYPSAAAGIESLRLRGASNEVVTFLNVAVERATRHQQVVEIRISPKENVMVARSADLAFTRQTDIVAPLRISAVLPVAPGADPLLTRRFLIYPGGTVPRIGIELSTGSGRKRMVSIDPITGVPEAR
jgi:prepilin-type N-terminal cleavage/methylation domain-containing protein